MAKAVFDALKLMNAFLLLGLISLNGLTSDVVLQANKIAKNFNRNWLVPIFEGKEDGPNLSQASLYIFTNGMN